eukprot:9728249-Lingulodinium_polyedra.AAC.1
MGGSCAPVAYCSSVCASGFTMRDGGGYSSPWNCSARQFCGAHGGPASRAPTRIWPSAFPI